MKGVTLAAQRRQRFRATVIRPGSTQIEELHFLTYTKDQAIRLAERRGIKIVTILTPAQFKAQQPAVGRAYKIDQAALAEAIEFLGLKLKVRIRFNARQGRVNGNYKRDYMGHDIMLKSYLTVEQASKTLWHELAHAMQSERAGSVWDWNVVANEKRPGRSRRIEYRNRPIEVEARTYEQYAEIIQIAVPS